MTDIERQEQIERWATSIIPAVFAAENAVKIKQPEWIKKLQDVTAETMQEVSDAYCRAIAEEIINNSH
jgi:hypothetical protein